MSKTTNKFSSEVREAVVRLVLDNEGSTPSPLQFPKAGSDCSISSK